MTQVTEVDFEVKEEQVTRYKCDECGNVVEEEHINTQNLYDGVSSTNVEESGHLCDACVEREQYLTLVQMANLKHTIGTVIGKSFSYSVEGLWIVLAGTIGIAMGTLYSLVRTGPRVMGDASVLTTADALVILFLGLIISLMYLTISAELYNTIFNEGI